MVISSLWCGPVWCFISIQPQVVSDTYAHSIMNCFELSIFMYVSTYKFIIPDYNYQFKSSIQNSIAICLIFFERYMTKYIFDLFVRCKNF